MKPGWHIVGASVQGTSHQKHDIPCQDAHSCRVLPGGVAVIAVADGAGTAGHSAEGARCAVEQVIDALATALAQGPPGDEAGMLIEAFERARQAVIELAEGEGEPLRAFAATLTCAVACQDWLIVGQIGDCLVVAKGEDDQLFLATQLQRGEYANETFFLTMDDALQRVEVMIHPPVRALAVMSDGLTRLAINMAENVPYLPFFQPLLRFAATVEDEVKAQEQLAAFLVSDRICARTDDDKTLVLAVFQGQT